MKINEVEERVGVSKANIRFYEKQGLLNPTRGANGYRVYEEADVLVLQQIVILRKLGLSVEQIGKIFSGELPLQEAVASNIISLKEQIEQLNGSLELSKQIASEGCESLDTPRYWNMIQQKEAAGQKFTDIVNEYWVSFLEPQLLKKFGLVKTDSLKTKVIQIVLVIVGVALIQTFIFKNSTFLRSLFYVPMLVIGIALLTFPLYWLNKRHPKIGSVVTTIVGILCLIIFAVVIVVAVVALLVAGWNTVFS